MNFGIIQLNPEKSKHLATAAVQIGSISIDFSNLRTENYTDSSRIPIIELGTPQEDAFRRCGLNSNLPQPNAYYDI